MNTRSALPTPAQLGVSSPDAVDRLTDLGIYSPESKGVLDVLSSTGDPTQAVEYWGRIQRQETPEDNAELLDTVHNNEQFAQRFLALLGGSEKLADYISTVPGSWRLLQQDLPTREEMFTRMLSAVDSQPQDETATSSLSTPGTYRSGIVGIEARRQLTTSYRSIIAQIAAYDLARTSEMLRTSKSEKTYNSESRYAADTQFEYITESLTDAADAALTAALSVAVATVYGPDDEPDPLAVIALGKAGAQELNYISDVDVIFVGSSADSKITRLAAEFVSIGSASFFEVDTALRPEGKHGALVRTLESHSTYYDRWAETWEFQALLKSRPMTGSMELGEQYYRMAQPLIWKSAERDDFVADVRAMRGRVVDNIPPDQQNLELKLGSGGLRDVEFAVQLLQLVHGRADVSIRHKGTVPALKSLIHSGYIGREDGKTLIEDYEFLRLLEHRLQLKKLTRTHLLPPESDTEARTTLARVSGISPHGTTSRADTLKKLISTVSSEVHQLHQKLFYRPLLESVAAMSLQTLQLGEESVVRQLAALGYVYPERALEHLRSLVSSGDRRANIQMVLLPGLMEWLGHTVDPDSGLLYYRKLSEQAQHLSIDWFLRILRDESVVGQRLMYILGTSPYASDLLLNAQSVIRELGDGARGPKLSESNPTASASSLVRAAQRYPTAQQAISTARTLRRVELARIASADLLGFSDTITVADQLSRIWTAVLQASLDAEIREWVLNHPDQPHPPAKIAVIGMGRLGGKELGYVSDADVLFVADPNDGVDSYDAIKWATARIENVRTYLSKPSNDPPLVVDANLRPEGRSGAIVRTLDSYKTYYEKWAETWEIQSLLRASYCAGDKELGERFLHMVDKFRYPERGIDQERVQELRRMKARVDSERLPQGADRNTETKLGRGGLADIEWTVQLLTMQYAHSHPKMHNTSTLQTLDVIKDEEILPASDVDKLKSAWILATQARNALRLSTRGKVGDQLPRSGKQLQEVAAAAGWDPEDPAGFIDYYLHTTRTARRVVDRIFWGEELSEHEA